LYAAKFVQLIAEWNFVPQ